MWYFFYVFLAKFLWGFLALWFVLSVYMENITKLDFSHAFLFLFLILLRSQSNYTGTWYWKEEVESLILPQECVDKGISMNINIQRSQRVKKALQAFFTRAAPGEQSTCRESPRNTNTSLGKDSMLCKHTINVYAPHDQRDQGRFLCSLALSYFLG